MQKNDASDRAGFFDVVASSDSEDESDIDLHIRAENLEAVVQDGLSKLKVDEDSHGKEIS